MKRMVTFSALGLLLVLVLGPALVMAQGKSAIKVNKITITPSTFRAGNSLAFKIDIENTDAPTGPGTAYLDVFKADTYLAADRLWGTTQPVAAMTRGEKRTVTFTAKWTVPSVKTDKFVFRAGVIDPPNEFAQTASVIFRLSYYGP